MRSRTTNTNRRKVIVVAAVLTVCLFVPVWQSAVCAQLSRSIEIADRNIALMEEQGLILKSRIAKQMTPEYLIEQASVRNISFSQIESAYSTTVASNY
ncbi:MAG: hypothetical protein MJ052_03860 [Sphaerochaetaceae bacterium]|nr:hypothetical protein [Sphaerochaetaceae bacterium]